MNIQFGIFFFITNFYAWQISPRVFTSLHLNGYPELLLGILVLVGFFIHRTLESATFDAFWLAIERKQIQYCFPTLPVQFKNELS